MEEALLSEEAQGHPETTVGKVEEESQLEVCTATQMDLTGLGPRGRRKKINALYDMKPFT